MQMLGSYDQSQDILHSCSNRNVRVHYYLLLLECRGSLLIAASQSHLTLTTAYTGQRQQSGHFRDNYSDRCGCTISSSTVWAQHRKHCTIQVLIS